MSKTQVTKEVESKSQQRLRRGATVSWCQRPKLLKKLKANHNYAITVIDTSKMSKTQVTKEVESKSQHVLPVPKSPARCQRPKLLKKLKANHNQH